MDAGGADISAGSRPMAKSITDTFMEKLQLRIREECSSAQVQLPKTFGEIAAKWLKEASVQLKRSTIEKYRTILNVHLLPEFGAMPVSQIRYEHISDLCIGLLSAGGKSGEGLSSKTTSDIYSVLKNVLKYAERYGYHTELGNFQIHQSHKAMRVFSFEEEQSIINYLMKNLDGCGLCILLGLLTGIRIGEVCALKWEDVHLEDHTLVIEKTMQRLHSDNGKRKTEIVTMPPKSEASMRRIPLSDNTIKILEPFCGNPDAYISTGRIDKAIEPRTLHNHFKKVLSSCGIPQATFHTLRHTFATRCMEMGVDAKCLSELLGHSNVSITLNRYVHPSIEARRQCIRMFADLYNL